MVIPLKRISHYVQRTRDLGLMGTLKRVQTRFANHLQLWGQAAWWGWVARRGLSDAALLDLTVGNYHSIDVFLKHLTERPASSYLLPHDLPRETGKMLTRYFPRYVATVLSEAEAICRNEMQLLGQVYTFQNGIDWNMDPVTGWHWPRDHRNLVGKYLGAERPVDLIVFWELNRHQHLITLGIAYWLTNEQRFVDKAIAHIQSWVDNNQVQHGVNWYYPLEISIRLIGWTAAFQFFNKSQVFMEDVGKSFLKSLWQQADFLRKHLQSTREHVPNNHMIAELTGLVVVGAAFPEFHAATSWLRIGLELLNQQSTLQTHSDGVNKEQATGYHRFIAELLMLVVTRSRQGVIPPQPILEQILGKMLEYVHYSLTPVGTIPQWGDSDYGRALGLGLDKDFWDFRPLLSSGALLFNRPEWKLASGALDQETFWLIGQDALDQWEQLETKAPEQVSRSFPDSGLYIIRDRWSTDTDVVFFRCGPFGLGGEGHCAHAHCDLLSLILWVNGNPLLVDSGTYIYHGPLRNHFRLTSAHNTILVDENEQAIPMPNFNWTQVPKARCTGWSNCHVKATMAVKGNIVLTRELRHPQNGTWYINDSITGENKHKVEWFFNFAPGLDLQFGGKEKGVTVLQGMQPISVMQMPNDISCHVREGWYSHHYGVKEETKCLHAIWNGDLRSEGLFFQWHFESAGSTKKVTQLGKI